MVPKTCSWGGPNNWSLKKKFEGLVLVTLETPVKHNCKALSAKKVNGGSVTECSKELLVRENKQKTKKFHSRPPAWAIFIHQVSYNRFRQSSELDLRWTFDFFILILIFYINLCQFMPAVLPSSPGLEVVQYPGEVSVRVVLGVHRVLRGTMRRISPGQPLHSFRRRLPGRGSRRRTPGRTWPSPWGRCGWRQPGMKRRLSIGLGWSFFLYF